MDAARDGDEVSGSFDQEAFGRALRARMGELGHTQTDTASRLGCAVGTVGRWCRGDSPKGPYPSHSDALREYFGEDADATLHACLGDRYRPTTKLRVVADDDEDSDDNGGSPDLDGIERVLLHRLRGHVSRHELAAFRAMWIRHGGTGSDWITRGCDDHE